MKTKRHSFLARAAMTLLLAVLTTTTAWAVTKQFPLYEGDEGTEAKPYQIKTKDDLKKLADDVNSGTGYSGKYFVLTADITYTGGSETANNYTAIGREKNSSTTQKFMGKFNGQGHTISGIRIYRNSSDHYNDLYQGLFGYISNTAEVKNVILADAIIGGGDYVGGIVGGNDGGNVENCHVLGDVTVHAVKISASSYGGIVGSNRGTVTGCTSAAALTIADGKTGCKYYGGIVGFNTNTGTVSQCIYFGNSLGGNQYVGAIAGYNNGTVQTSYFTDSDIRGKDKDGNTLANANSAVGQNSSTGTVAATVGPARKVTLGTGVSTTVPATNWDNGFTYGGNNYYRVGLELPLAYSPVPTGASLYFSVNGVPTTLSGNKYTVNATDGDVTIIGFAATPWTGSGDTENDPYIIETPGQLDLLAYNVNSNNTYWNKYFALGADITYTGGSETESNYTAIGGRFNGNNKYFNGHFDGKGHTISGIRIYKGGTGNADCYQGLFGRIDDEKAEVKNIILADAIITGHDYTGAIVGENGRSYNSTVKNCHILSNVTVHAVQTGWNHGGIVGRNYNGTIIGCTSAAALTTATTADCRGIGGIAGDNNDRGTISQCLYLGTTLEGTAYVGAIAGVGSGTVNNSYYTDTNIQGKDGSGTALDNAASTFGQKGNDATVTYSGPAHTITLENGITLGGTATEYGPLTAYGDFALTYKAGSSTTIYSTADNVIALNNYSGTMPTGHTFGDYIATNGGIIGGNATEGYTLTMPDDDVTVTAFTAIPWSGSGSEADPYMINNKGQLDLLAHRIKSHDPNDADATNGYSGKYFKLGADITYTGGSSTESNYIAIGGYFDGSYRNFAGHFNGNNKTISGIRIYKTNDYQGLFGRIYDSGAKVENVILADATITGESSTGGIVGYNYEGTVENCRVLSDVTVHNVQSPAWSHGGIVGHNYKGTVTGCTSAAALTSADGVTVFGQVGGIAGDNENGTISQCLYLGTTLEGTTGVGAIAGKNSGTAKNCYYTDTNIQGKNTDGAALANAESTFGFSSGTVTNCGLLTNSLIFEDHGTENANYNSDLIVANNDKTRNVVLNGRTLYKDGKWNTICLPFDVDMTDPAGPLYGATYRTVTNASISGTTLNLTFAEKQRDTDPDNKLMAGMPYIIKWNSGDDIVNPVFTGVKIIHVGGGYMGASVRFSGNNDTMTDVKTQALPGFDKLLLGDDNKLHYAGDGASLGAFRAYFAVDPTKVGTANARLTSFNIDFGDGETTALIENEAGAWYSLDGRKLSGKPTKSGIYVNNGGKVVIK